MWPIIKAAFIGFGISVGLLLVPLVHFVSGPAGPFIGGFMGGSSIKARPAQAIGVGILMGILAGLMVALGLGIAEAMFQVLSEGSLALYLLIGAVVVFYVGALGGVGALTGGHMAQRRTPAESESSSHE